MLGLSDLDDPGTGEGDETRSDPIEAARERGRQKAVDVILGTDDELAATADGGLSMDAIEFARSCPSVDPESVADYDENTQPYRKADRSGRLPPRGERGNPVNYERSIQVNEARAALREFRDYQERTD